MIHRWKSTQYISFCCGFFLFFLCCAASHELLANDVSWQKHFVKNEAEIPVNKFRAYYFDERTAGIVRHTEVVDRPAANFVEKPFHRIPGDNFGGYWVGYFDFAEPKRITISTYQSHAETKIFIDGQVVPDRETARVSSKNAFEYTFAPGRHKIEVQHVSNYFSVSFLVNMIENLLFLDNIALAQKLGDTRDQNIWYCGAYESDNFDMSVDVTLEASTAPVILFLSSHQPIIWKISNPHQSKIRAIVLSSSSPSSSVENIPANIPVLYAHSLPCAYELVAKSSSSSDSRNTFKNLAYTIQNITGQKPVGFSGKYGLTSVRVPEIVLDDAVYSRLGMRLHGKKRSLAPTRAKESRLDQVFED